MIDPRATSPGESVPLPSDHAGECAYCHLPVPGRRRQVGAEYCCLGCRLAAEITGGSGPEGEARWTLARLGLALFLSLNVMMFTMVLWTQEMYDARSAGSGPLAESLADLFRYLCLVLSLPVLALLGWPLCKNALAAARRDVGAADLLILLGVVAAYGYSVVSVLRGTGHVYFEVGCVILLLVTAGRWLEATGKLRTTQALESLEQLLPREVRLVGQDGGVRVLPADQMVRGDHIRVLAGERFAADGMLVTGCASVCEQLLTGESTPTTKRPGDFVLGGSTNLDGELTLEVVSSAQEGSLARLIELVRAARRTKGRYHRLADRISGWFLPGVLAVAVGTFFVHWQWGDLETALLSFLAVLLIACPCALGVATPLAVWTALGTAARRGVLFKHGEALERLSSIRALRFDKTGTLSTGEPLVASFAVAASTSPHEVRARARRLASASTHVFSQAIERFLDAESAQDEACVEAHAVAAHPGLGVSALVRGEPEPSQLGSLSWLEGSGLRLSLDLAAAVREIREQARSMTAIGWGGEVRGIFAFEETIRAEAATALAQCSALGCDVAVLTGDAPERCRSLDRELGAPVTAGLLPAGKVAAVESARRAWGPVAMVGDGVNDAPALAASDLGIALGCGADLSRESAQVCLVGNDLMMVPWAIALARRTVRVIRQNLLWAFGYNTVGIVLAASGRLNPVWAAVAMVASSSFVAANSMRLRDRRHEDPAASAQGAGPGNRHLETASDKARETTSKEVNRPEMADHAPAGPGWGVS